MLFSDPVRDHHFFLGNGTVSWAVPFPLLEETSLCQCYVRFGRAAALSGHMRIVR